MEHPRTTDHERWNRARAFAGRQRCDAAIACDFADWVVEGVAAGRIALPARFEDVFGAWMRKAGR